jgi:hypothetical protein
MKPVPVKPGAGIQRSQLVTTSLTPAFAGVTAFYETGSLVFPVSNSCIIPYLSARVLASRRSSASISASMSESTVAMVDCSSFHGEMPMVILILL